MNDVPGQNQPNPVAQNEFSITPPPTAFLQSKPEENTATQRSSIKDESTQVLTKDPEPKIANETKNSSESTPKNLDTSPVNPMHNTALEPEINEVAPSVTDVLASMHNEEASNNQQNLQNLVDTSNTSPLATQASQPQRIEQQNTVPQDKSTIYSQICTQIIREQEQIIGSLAYEQAQSVSGLAIDPSTHSCQVTSNGVEVIDNLINQYQDFFGHAAVEVCKEAASPLIIKLPEAEIPTSLK